MEENPTKVRKLNVEEKRKLEKLLIADIDSTRARYDMVSSDERQALIDRIEHSPAPEAKAIFERYNAALKQQEELTKKLHSLGYEVGFTDKLEVRTSGKTTKQLAEFDDCADKVRDSLTAIKRTYLIRLYAAHAHPQSLFDSLAKDLERIVR